MPQQAAISAHSFYYTLSIPRLVPLKNYPHLLVKLHLLLHPRHQFSFQVVHGIELVEIRTRPFLVLPSFQKEFWEAGEGPVSRPSHCLRRRPLLRRLCPVHHHTIRFEKRPRLPLQPRILLSAHLHPGAQKKCVDHPASASKAPRTLTACGAW